MCRIGLTKVGVVHQLTYQPCLTPASQNCLEDALPSVLLCLSELLAMVERLA